MWVESPGLQARRQPPTSGGSRHWEPSSDGGETSGRAKPSFLASSSAVLALRRAASSRSWRALFLTSCTRRWTSRKRFSSGLFCMTSSLLLSGEVYLKKPRRVRVHSLSDYTPHGFSGSPKVAAAREYRFGQNGLILDTNGDRSCQVGATLAVHLFPFLRYTQRRRCQAE